MSATSPDRTDFLEELRWRGLLHQATDESGLQQHLAEGTRRAYCGFDPTADSLTIGNLVPIITLVHFARAGHEPVVVMGGGTGLIGDPSGKSAERQLRTPEEVAANVEKQRDIFRRVFENAGLPEPTIRNNYEWLKELSFIDVLRDVGKHFSVNMMIHKESVKERLHNREQGISYTEFSYMILQAYDYLKLYRDEHDGGWITLQIGGSDQWGNIVSGIDLIKKFGQSLSFDIMFNKHPNADFGENPNTILDKYDESSRVKIETYREAGGWGFLEYPKIKRDLIEKYRESGYDLSRILDPDDEEAQLVQKNFNEDLNRLYLKREGWSGAFGLTVPLVTKADGGKFGKTESGAVWLTAPVDADADEARARRTSAFAMHQFWLNTADADVVRFLKVFTLLPRAEIERLEAEHAEAPHKRAAQRALAHHATALVHGEDEAHAAEAAAAALFSGDVRALPKQTLFDAMGEAPSSNHAKGELAGEGVALLDVLIGTGLAKSKREAREFLEGGSVSVNGEKAGADRRLTEADLLHGEAIALRRGKKQWHLTRWA
ncbi:MAG: tyrosine--tRNA ligase [Phycisphaerales bacterium]|nr:MAG: tyrosine--tRNA ligase [Phycisphaerales bacterium]